MHSSARAEGRAKWDEENQARLAEEERTRYSNMPPCFCGRYTHTHTFWPVDAVQQLGQLILFIVCNVAGAQIRLAKSRDGWMVNSSLFYWR